MIPHTKSFKRLKDEAQATFDFAIVVCYAIPSLKTALKNLGPNEGLPFEPDYFDTRPIPTEKVKNHVKEYKAVLSRHIFISSFSYFEAYFIDLLREIVEFHDKTKLLSKHAIIKNEDLTSPELQKSVKKLREYPNRKNLDAYKTHGKRLAANGFVFPSGILAQHGLRQLIELIESDKIRSVEIPNLIESVLQLPLDSATETEQFHTFRKMRNKIAHGRPEQASLHLSKAIEANNFLRNLALRVDEHVTRHILLVEL